MAKSIEKCSIFKPVPILDNLDKAKETFTNNVLLYNDLPNFAEKDFNAALAFLKDYNGSKATLSTYRSTTERLLQWSWFINKKSIFENRRIDITQHIEFLQNPPVTWIGTSILPRFKNSNGSRVPNYKWRPFVVKVMKEQHRQQTQPNVKKYSPSPETIKGAFTALGSLYSFLIDEDYIDHNPVKSIKQKSKFFSTGSAYKPVQRITNLQWDLLVDCLTRNALINPKKYARSKFLVILMLQTYARLSDLVTVRSEEPPKMNDFYRDSGGLWWVKFTGKGNKIREIPVSDTLLDALKEFRLYLGFTEYPSPNEQFPMLPTSTGKPITCEKTLRNVVQEAFDLTVIWMKNNNYETIDYENLLHASAHWLRHTSISEDIKHRPRDHVKEDAGHGSYLTTERYIESDRLEKHQSAISRDLTPSE